MRKLFVDLDDTYMDTEVYIRRILKANGYNFSKKQSIYDVDVVKDFKWVFDEVFSNYSFIPKKIGAEECLNVLETEYGIVFVSCYSTEEEKISKYKFAKECGKDIILCKDFDKSFIDMSEGIMFDDVAMHLLNSGLPSKSQYLMFNRFNVNEYWFKNYVKFNGNLVFDWYEFCDKVMEVEEDAELREYICSRIQGVNKRSRV